MGLSTANGFAAHGVGRTPMIARSLPDGSTEYTSRITGHRFIIESQMAFNPGTSRWRVSCERLNLDETCNSRDYALGLIEIEDCLG